MHFPTRWWTRLLLAVAVAYALACLLLVTADVQAATPSQRLATADVIATNSPATRSYQAGCHNRIWRTLTVRLHWTHTVVAWRRTAVDQWCWNSRGRITDLGLATGDDGKWAAWPYCWDTETSGKVWNTASRSEAKVWNQGTLKVCGKFSPGLTINPRIYFHAPDRVRRYAHWNFGGTAVYPR